MSDIQKGIYEHYKGKRYEVLDVATHTETQEVMVVYKALYRGNFPEGALWVRPLTMFQEQVSVEGKSVPRFLFLGANTAVVEAFDRGHYSNGCCGGL